MFYPASTVFNKMNAYGAKKKPFLFGIDFNKENGFFCEPQQAKQMGLDYTYPGQPSPMTALVSAPPISIKKMPVSYEVYQQAFENVRANILAGRSYLTNLTFATPIEMNIGLEEAYHRCHSKYKVSLPGHFLFFSPETFVQIQGDTIASFPMKGTMDARIENAATLLLQDPKEQAEHATITDLIKNDLSQVAQNVQVEKYRYLERINTNGKPLLQVSSKITGSLARNWQQQVGSLMECLLPAGSISGAPKESTLQIIRESEISTRGYYTGVFGIFDGDRLDSAVMIRFIALKEGKLIFYSGGGITSQSDPKKEYQEMIDKIYVPIY